MLQITNKYSDPCTITINEKIIRQFNAIETQKSFTLLTYKYCKENGIIDKIKNNFNKKKRLTKKIYLIIMIFLTLLKKSIGGLTEI